MQLRGQDRLKERYEDILEDFLIPFESNLQANRSRFNELIKDTGLTHIELLPKDLQEAFQSLPDNDVRIVQWHVDIDHLMEYNNRSIQLINRYLGKIVLDDFKSACEKFRNHAEKWEDVWKLVLKKELMPPSVGNKLLAPPFPKELNDKIRDEIKEIKRLAGKAG